MKIVEESIRRITISQVPNLDPIRVALEDIEPGKGRINIECYGTSWACYWGGMGKQTIAEFFSNCNVGYLAEKLSTVKPSVFNPDELINILKREVIHSRQCGYVDKEEARHRFDMIEALDLPECEQQLWCMADEMYTIMGDEWWYRLPEKPNPEYEYLCRIICAVQEALSLTRAAMA